MLRIARLPQSGNTQIHDQFRHGADLAILGLPRSLCRHWVQRAGYDQMAAELAVFDRVAEASIIWGNPYPDEWSARLGRRLHEAEERRGAAFAGKAVAA